MRRYGHAAAVGALLASASCSFTSSGTYGADASLTQAPEASADAGTEASTLVIPSTCSGLSPPPTLDCTGLYTDVATKTLAPQVRAYAPAVPLWADGSGKDRWIYLPPGTQINTTDPSNWSFPAGTRVWKQFSRDGVRVETRYFYKMPLSNIWAYGTYQWSADESSATLSPGGNITLPGDGGTYHIPTITECRDCHGGSADSLLGVSQVELGLSGATGLTLDQMVKENLLTPVPTLTALTIGDDGTGHAAAPLAWLNINCGMACHNTNPSAQGSSFGMILKLDPTQLDGRASNHFPSILTTVGVAAVNPAFAGETRIVPGNPTASLLHQLINERGSLQMPPIASLLVDTPDVAAVAEWIAAMPPAAPIDAGSDAITDATVDAPYDAGKHDGGKHDGGLHDASYGDGSSDDSRAGDASAEGSIVTDGATPDGDSGGDAGPPGDAKAD